MDVTTVNISKLYHTIVASDQQDLSPCIMTQQRIEEFIRLHQKISKLYVTCNLTVMSVKHVSRFTTLSNIHTDEVFLSCAINCLTC